MLGKLLTATYRPSQRTLFPHVTPMVMNLIRWGMTMSLMSMSITAIVAGIGTLSNQNQISVSPFMPYEGIMPEHPANALADFDCREIYMPSTLKQHRCTIFPESRYFESINVTHTDNSIIEVGITLKSVRIGDLIMLWGQPSDTYKEKRRYVFVWDNGATAYVLQRDINFVNLYWAVSSVIFRAS